MRRLLACCLLVLSVAAEAQVTLQGHLSVVGAGAELGYRGESGWGGRVGLLYGDFDVDFETEDTNGFPGDELHYDSDIDLENAYLLADWYPWNTRFRVTAGAVLNGSGATVITRCDAQSIVPGTESCEFGNSRFSPAILGEITTKVDFDDLAPYLGIGWGHRARSGFAVTVDLGVAYVGEAQVDMTSSGNCNENAQCRAEIEREEDEIREELHEYRYLPFAMLGVSYQF